MNPFDLTGTTALVSGSSRGIGLALAKGLLQAGQPGHDPRPQSRPGRGNGA